MIAAMIMKMIAVMIMIMIAAINMIMIKTMIDYGNDCSIDCDDNHNDDQ